MSCAAPARSPSQPPDRVRCKIRGLGEGDGLAQSAKGAERPAAIHLGCFLPDLTR